MIINLPINHSDDRGSIRDIFVGTPKDHCSIITFTPGAVRANHFHKLTTQYTYVIDGEITMATSVVDESGNATSEIEKRVLIVGDLVTHPPYHAHAFRAITKATILAFADGLRGGLIMRKMSIVSKGPWFEGGRHISGTHSTLRDRLAATQARALVDHTQVEAPKLQLGFGANGKEGLRLMQSIQPGEIDIRIYNIVAASFEEPLIEQCKF